MSEFTPLTVAQPDSAAERQIQRKPENLEFTMT